MPFSDQTWARTAAITRFGLSSTDAMLTSLAVAHFAAVRLGPSMGTNVPDDDPKAITTHMRDTGLGAIIRARV